ncbi:hypothetical protein AYI68_g5162 [Smittium mucronatum]|uniref:Fungal lipase-type domain-containing protein n=1 Tax=Smittium mucronatum TaxID=133383 RepID=A0A1R0GV40_9FUNG|nr:hypothetical protein AYI68_g5162 [Smittium mucronatum]
MAQWIFVHVLPHMLSYAFRNKIKKINFVGHSLGAATAAVLLLIIKFESIRIEKQKIPLGKFKFTAWCYGTLPCVSYNLAKSCLLDGDSDSINPDVPFSIFTFIHSRDMVGSLSYGSVMDVKSLILAAYEKSETFSQSLAMKRIIDDEENLKLVIPGKVYLITSTGPDKTVNLKRTIITNILRPDAFGDSNILNIVKGLHPGCDLDPSGIYKFFPEK